MLNDLGLLDRTQATRQLANWKNLTYSLENTAVIAATREEIMGRLHARVTISHDDMLRPLLEGMIPPSSLTREQIQNLSNEKRRSYSFLRSNPLITPVVKKSVTFYACTAIFRPNSRPFSAAEQGI